MSLTRVAVIGAGMSGLVCARTLRDQGVQASIFDKGRRPGGRMSSRATGGGETFDHGAQYFTARDSAFREQVAAWRERGVVSLWRGRFVTLGDPDAGEPPASDRYVGAPLMNQPCLELAAGLDVRGSTRITRIERCAARLWNLWSGDEWVAGGFDQVVLALPPSQAAGLAPDDSPLRRRLEQVTMRPCWAVMATFAEPVPVDFDGAFVRNSPLAWAARTSAKPGRRATPERWVLHATPDWSERFLEDEPERVAARLVDEWAETLRSLPALSSAVAHRWRFALADEPLADGCLRDPERGLVACGDWCSGSRVEGAYLSGLAAARALLGVE